MFELVDPVFRLVSVYYNKFFNKKRAGSWIKMSKEIIKLYRCKQVMLKETCNVNVFKEWIAKLETKMIHQHPQNS